MGEKRKYKIKGTVSDKRDGWLGCIPCTGSKVEYDNDIEYGTNGR